MAIFSDGAHLAVADAGASTTQIQCLSMDGHPEVTDSNLVNAVSSGHQVESMANPLAPIARFVVH